MDLEVVLSSGKIAKAKLKAWLPDRASDLLRWERRRISPMCGYVNRSVGTQTCRRYREMKQFMAAFVEAGGLDITAEIGCWIRSAVSVSKTSSDNNDAMEASEQEYWVSTRMMFFIMVNSMAHRREKEHRDNIREYLKEMMRKTLPAGEMSLAVLRPPPEAKAACRTGCARDDDVCSCMEDLLSIVNDGELPQCPQDR